MTTLRKEAYGPRGDASRHLPLEVLRAGLAALPEPPRDAGAVALIVCRRPDGERATPAEVLLTPEEGVTGDGWSRRPPRDVRAQITVMWRDVAALIANGQPLTLFGDNVIVDLDLAVANLPAGSRLRVGEALVEVTSKPHNGCSKFEGRFGADALAFVQAPETRHRNLRGIHWQVIASGLVRPSSPIQVLSRSGDMTLTVRPFATADRRSLEALWSRVFADDPPRNAPALLIARKLEVQPELLLVAMLGQTMVGAAMAGYDGVRGWIHHLAVAPEWRRHGFATALVHACEKGLRRLGCPKVNLQVRATNADVVAFYRRLGYEVEERISMGRLLEKPR